MCVGMPPHNNMQAASKRSTPIVLERLHLFDPSMPSLLECLDEATGCWRRCKRPDGSFPSMNDGQSSRRSRPSRKRRARRVMEKLSCRRGSARTSKDETMIEDEEEDDDELPLLQLVSVVDWDW